VYREYDPNQKQELGPFAINLEPCHADRESGCPTFVGASTEALRCSFHLTARCQT